MADPVADREAWKDFLSSIQNDQGSVHPSVWEFVPQIPQTQNQLGDPPTWKEFQSVLSKMSCGKRGGIDDVIVELIRFGGETLNAIVFDIISTMWSDACQAEPGHEADKWSSSTTTGICIPVYKQKGCRSERKNYRNLVMLSVAA